MLRDKDALAGKDLQVSIDIGVQFHTAEILRRGNWKPVKLGSTEVQHALSEDPDLQAHIALGDDLILQDSKDRLVPPELGRRCYGYSHRGNHIPCFTAHVRPEFVYWKIIDT